MELKQSIGDRLEELEEADVVVGILTKNVEPTILHVMNVVREEYCSIFPHTTH